MSIISRESKTNLIANGTRLGTNYIIPTIRRNIANGNIRCIPVILQENERLDTLAGKYYNDGTLGFIIGAASNIGFIPQVPAGTAIKIPLLEDVLKYI